MQDRVYRNLNIQKGKRLNVKRFPLNKINLETNFPENSTEKICRKIQNPNMLSGNELVV